MKEKQEKRIRSKILLAIRKGMDKILDSKMKVDYIIADEVFEAIRGELSTGRK